MRKALKNAVSRLPVPVRNALVAAYQPLNPGRWRAYPAPHSAIRLRCAAEQSGGGYVVAKPEVEADWSQLRYVDGEPVEFKLELPRRMREEAVGWVGEAVVMNHQAWPVTSRGELIINAVTVRRGQDRAFAQSQRLMRPKRLRGHTLNIACAATRKNYAHSVMDGLGRLGVAVAAGVDLATLDHVIVPGHPSPALARLLDLAGVPREKRRPAVYGAHFQVDNLIQPTAAGRTPFYSGTGPDFLRSLGVEATSGAPRRLLMMREGAARRSISNPEGLEQLARDYELTIYDPASSEFSPADIAAADLIVGAHGASLGDMGFCAPGTRLVEVLPSAHLETHFATLAVGAQFRYVAVRATSVNGEYEDNFEVDYDAIREGIDYILAQP